MLIEDDEDDQEFFVEAISGIRNTKLFYIARNGKEAIEMLSTTEVLPDIIFTDINMPLMNGIECFLKIVKNPLTRNIPVVFLSTDVEQKSLLFNLGAKAFIQKPNDSETLCSELLQVISHISAPEIKVMSLA